MPLLDSRVSRRRFLQVSAAAATAVAVPQLFAAEADPYGGFKMGLQSYTLRAFDARTALEHTRNLGLHYWESFPNHVPLSTLPDHIREQKALLKEYDINLVAYGVVSFNSDETKAREIFDFAKGIGLVSISANPKKDAATFDLLDKLVEEYGIPVAIHNHGPGADYDKIQDVVDFVHDRHPLIGACVDTGHYLRSDENPVDAIRILGPRVFGVHFKDVRTVRDPAELAKLEQTLPEGRVRQLKAEGKLFTILGEGELDVLGCLKELRKLNYDRCLALEYEENEQNPLSDIEISLQTVREAVKKLDA
ncbi:MAG: sugar phosphate isomerase/epimerase [Planctomycetaceae bacterium]|nr:sugar phosphate isomerase/epimerase [Planctomycetaceae bacterium]